VPPDPDVPTPVYDTIGHAYTTHRQPDPRWAVLLLNALAGAGRIVNVGAGAGSYEPNDSNHEVIAVEPSMVMVSQRHPGAAPVVRASGTALPLAAKCADAVMAVLTLHHWGDWRAGLSEMCRVAPRRVILTIDFDLHAGFWLLDDYLPEVADYVRRRRPRVDEIAAAIPVTTLTPLPLPHDLTDGVLGAQWRHPEAYLNPVVRANTSPLALADPATVDRAMAALSADLKSGAWAERHADLLTADSYDLGYRLLVSAEE
jgi:SAM-dependent methyltransferase